MTACASSCFTVGFHFQAGAFTIVHLIVSNDMIAKELKLLNDQYKNANNLGARINLYEKYSLEKHDFHFWVFDQLLIPEGARILELGAGLAVLWKKNIKRLPLSWKITVSDFFPGMLEDAKGLLENTGKQFG